MDKKMLWKWILLIGLLGFSLALVVPMSDVKDDKNNIVQHGKIKLGLDLRGGSSFLVEIIETNLTENAMKDAQDRALEVIRNRVDQLGVAEPVIYPEPGGKRITVQIPGMRSEDRDRAKKLIESAAFLSFRLVHEKSETLVADLFAKGLAPEGYSIVKLPDDPNGNYKAGFYYRLIKTGEGFTPTNDVRQAAKSFNAPPRYEMLMEKVRGAPTDVFKPIFVLKRHSSDPTGENLDNARVDFDNLQRPYVELSFDKVGRSRFGRLTGDYAPGGEKNPGDTRRYLAIVLDDYVYSAPWIKTPIYGGQAIIEGDFSQQEAADLVIALRAGSLPAPVQVIEQRTVDPTLGKDSIKSGVRAAMIGGIATCVFMILYYTLSGLITTTVLALDLLLLPIGMMIVGGFFSMFSGGGGGLGGALTLPTLTLPGIAGIALTIGMAVDANVLIFERIREEQRAGKTLSASIDAGFERAFSAIADSNITTLLTALVMFWFGTGPIRGYAVTLSAGIVVSLYTAIVVTRMQFELIERYSKIKSLKMFQLFGDTKIDFIKPRRIAIALSLLVIAGSWGLFVARGKANYGVDFVGGTALTFEFQKKVSEEPIRSAVAAAGIRDATITYQNIGGQAGEGKEVLEVKVPFESGTNVASIIATQFKDAGFKNIQEDSVGPQVGNEMKKKAVTAMIWSLAIMIVYIGVRFEFSFGMGAIVALFHDALVAIGLFCLFGKQLNMTSIACVLTIIGYSVNDTIVIFDRIREDLKLYKNKSFIEIANMALNQTLSRTILTSGTTLFSVLALMLFGGGAIADFALMLFIGMIAGTYSTIYIATPIVLWFRKEDRPRTTEA